MQSPPLMPHGSAAQPPAIFVMGPTASGKTDLAMALCEQLPCDIISVDSAMIYRGMDIGTAKPTTAELAKAPHRLIDIRDPAEIYSAADFRQDALAHMAEITAAGRIPLLVGGTMMYFKALLHGMSDLPPASPDLRASLKARAQAEGWATLHRELTEKDPVAAGLIHPNNRQRVLRALEVIYLTDKPLSELWRSSGHVEDYPYTTDWQADDTSGLPYTVMQFALTPKDRVVLHDRIRKRFLGMLEQGFVEEVEGLMGRGDLIPDLPSMRSVGYRQVWQWLEGEGSHETMTEKGIAATRQLAKRQLTWLRKWQDLTWLDSGDRENTDIALKKVETSIRLKLGH